MQRATADESQPYCIEQIEAGKRGSVARIEARVGAV